MLRPIILAAVLAVALPATADAAFTVRVSTTSGEMVPANGATITKLTPSIDVTPDNGNRFAVRVLGPDGRDATESLPCAWITANSTLEYHGNGTYTIIVTPHPSRFEIDCDTASGPAETFTFTQAASIAFGAVPTAPVLLRDPGSTGPKNIQVPLTRAPGALDNEIRFARNGTVGADGALTGTSILGHYNEHETAAELEFPAPGTYTVVARFVSNKYATGQYAGPWTPPVKVRVVAPFDLAAPKFSGSRRSGVSVHLQVREASTRGAVKLALARGNGAFKSVGSATLTSTARATKRLRLSRAGSYRLRVTYAGSETTNAGSSTVTFSVR